MRRTSLLSLMLLAAYVVLMFAGCAILTPAELKWIDDNRDNATVFASKTTGNAAIPAAVRSWIDSEALCWQAMSDIAHNRRPASQPAK